MKKYYKIGDRVLAKVFTKDELLNNKPGNYVKGVIIRFCCSDILLCSVFKVKYDSPINSNESGLHHITTLKLDVQYYREERLKKLLDNEKGL